MTVAGPVRGLPVELPLGDFHSESGGVIRDARLRYRVFGDPSLGLANGWILVFHALTGSADIDEWWAPVLGPGRALDTSRHAVASGHAPRAERRIRIEASQASNC